MIGVPSGGGRALPIGEQIRREYRRGPIAVVAGAVGAISVLANAVIFALSLTPGALQLLHSDVGLVLTLTAVILTQGTVAFVFSRSMVAILRLGVGFPILLVAVSILLMAWLLSFNAYWFAGFGAKASRLSAPDWYGIVLAASWPAALYVQAHAFVTKYDRK